MKTLFILFFLSSSVLAADDNQVLKCTGADGAIIYTNVGCESGKGELVLSKPITIIAPTPPMTMDVSFKPWQWALVIYLLMSIICFLFYRWDKQKAIRGEWRIPESTLHGLELFGGWPGAWVAQRTLRHKNRKLSHRIVFWLIVMLHVLAWEDYASGHLLWDLARGEKPVDIQQRVLEKVLEHSGLNTSVSKEDIEKGLKNIRAKPANEPVGDDEQ